MIPTLPSIFTALLIAGAAFLSSAPIASADAGAAAPDSIRVGTAEQAVGIALQHINGGEAAATEVDVLFSGAAARDTGAYWIVTVTRDGLTVLEPPRIIAVNKHDGSARSVFVEDHADEDDPRAQRPRRFR